MFLSSLNKKLVGYLSGVMLMWLGVLCVIPAIVSFIYGESQSKIFLFSVIVFVLLGFTLTYLCKNYSHIINKKDGQIMVGFMWIFIPFIACLPYMFFPQNFSISEAIFESYSGFTTTGSTMIDNFEHISKGMLVYRALTQWLGGLGFVLLIILSLRRFPGSFNNLFNAEFFSINADRLYPHLRDTVKRILYIYMFFTLACFLCLYLTGVNVVSSMCYALSTVSTGGFTLTKGGVSDLGDKAQYIIALFMFLGGVSFFLILRLIKGRFRLVVKDEQFRLYVFLIVCSTLLFILNWSLNNDLSVQQRIKDGLFYACSITSSTGYDIHTQNIGMFVLAVMVCLMFIGGCSASSATGLKVIRVVMLLKYTKVSLVRIFHPRAIIPVRYNGKAVLDEDIRRVFGFFFLYIVIFIIGVFLLCLVGNNFDASIVLSVANLSNIGPVINSYIPNFSYSTLNLASKFILITLMMIGRLEIYSFLALFSKSLWRKI